MTSERRLAFNVLMYPKDKNNLQEKLNNAGSLEADPIESPEETKLLYKVEVNNGFGKVRQVRNIVKASDGEIIGDPVPMNESIGDSIGGFLSKHASKFIIAYITIVAGALFAEVSDRGLAVDIAFLIAFPWISVLIVSVIPALGNVLGINKT